MGFSRSDCLLLHAADLADRTVETERSGRGDPVSALDVPSELLQQLEGEREPGRGAADAADLHPDLQRELDRDGLVGIDAEQCPALEVRIADRAYRFCPDPAASPEADLNRVARGVSPEQAAKIVDRSHALAIQAYDHVAGLEHATDRGPTVDAEYERSGRAGGDSVAERLEGHGGGNLLRDRHRVDLGAALDGLAQPAEHVRDLLQARAVVQAREQPLEQPGFPDADVDEVDAAGVRVPLCSSYLDD